MTRADRVAGEAERPSLLWVNQFASLPEHGGGTRHFELGRELVRHGWRVTIVASDLHLHRRTYTRRSSPSDRDVITETIDGVELRWLWTAPYSGNDWRRVRNWLGFSRGVRRDALGEVMPDIVIGSSPQLFAATAARALARRLRIPFVFEVRDLWPESLEAVGGRRGFAYRFLDRVANGLYRDADRVLVLARGTGEYLERRGVPSEKLIFVPNGVDIASLPLSTSAPRATLAENSLTLVYAGAHGPANGLESVLDAADAVAGSIDARFVLIGDGPAKSGLQTQARRRGLDNVEFRDPLPKPQLMEVLQSADAGLMVLRASPLFEFGVSPNKLFDYMAACIPVVCNVPGEVASMLAAAGAGIQAADSSGPSLAEAVRRFARLSIDDRFRMGSSGREWVAREHGRDVLGARLDGFLRTLLSDRADAAA